MPVDNDIYNRDADQWWHGDGYLRLLAAGVNPGRFEYFSKICLRRYGRAPFRRRLLDIGCGGGVLCESFARLGCQVTGVDPSAPGIEAAACHARMCGLSIHYMHVPAGAPMPFSSESFDIVCCCDVLEHVADPDALVAEAARVLKTWGIFFYDTVNRTFLSRIVADKLVQHWPPTRIFPRDMHDWRNFITPRELTAIMEKHRLRPGRPVGLSPPSNYPGVLLDIFRLKLA